jgi:hypothetical protein
MLNVITLMDRRGFSPAETPAAANAAHAMRAAAIMYLKDRFIIAGGKQKGVEDVLCPRLSIDLQGSEAKP